MDFHFTHAIDFGYPACFEDRFSRSHFLCSYNAASLEWWALRTFPTIRRPKTLIIG
jgi:hypothetical protein